MAPEATFISCSLWSADKALNRRKKYSLDWKCLSRSQTRRSHERRVFVCALQEGSNNWDVIVIGSGIGGLTAGAMLQRYGKRVLILESHAVPGGAAHSFVRNGYHFDSGPSFHCGLSEKEASTNPLRQCLDLLGESKSVDYVTYNRWNYYLPEGLFEVHTNFDQYCDEVQRFSPQGATQLRRLEREISPYHAASREIPAMAMRADPLIAPMLALRFPLPMAKMLPLAPTISGPASSIIMRSVSDPFLLRLLDLECFVLSGLKAEGTIVAEFAFVLGERGESTIDYPLGGGQAIVGALVRGLQKYGGQLRCNSHVDKILVEQGKAVGVRLHSKKAGAVQEEIRAPIVISNASIWDTIPLVTDKEWPEGYRQKALATPTTGSFMHLHLGIRAEGLDPNLLCHHCVMNDAHADIDAAGNVVIISIPSIFDPSLAPPGHHCVHAYSAGNEPFDIWKGLSRSDEQYKALKKERAEPLWRALERVIPDIRSRTTVELIGTPLTHASYLRRHRGTYGPAIEAGKESFPSCVTPIESLYHVGDSTMPGIGVPAVAASGIICANTIMPFTKHWAMLDCLPS